MTEIYLKCATDTDFAKLEGKSISSIKTDGNNGALTDASLLSISKIIGVEELDLEWATGISDEGLSKLSNIQSLKHLDISFCKNITKNGIAQLKSSNKELSIEH